jgi:hypothetical protein
MPLQTDVNPADSLCMETTSTNQLVEPSDQELVDLYTTHAPRGIVVEMTDSQIHHAAQAAYTLELRGYTEIAGTWLHDTRPALHARA